ncbi:hypothetical protein [Nonomuraea rubra]|uniref:Uncharacterized protein n=1 Tax=Nonomuraea rubra TaxID=46180 RepID=A0A7X0TXV1_9ACTN|nr:hypothetical protein [Nonomuraea rubra]MBB6547620.1 hypothetical protein [Nonomuraea rubra]
MLANILNILNLVVMFVLLVGGAVLMGMRRGEHGRAAVAGIVGCVVLLLAVIVSAALAFLAPTLVESLGIGGYQPVFMLVNAASMILQAVGTGLLIWAVVARRNPPQQARPGQGAWPTQPEWQHGQPEWQPGPQQPGPQQPWPQQPGPQQPGPQQQPPGWQTPPQPPFGQGPGQG